MRKVAILGATGSIGTQAISIILQFPGQFEVVFLSARSHWQRMRAIHTDFPAADVWFADADAAESFENESHDIKESKTYQLFQGLDELQNYLQTESIDLVINAFSGISGIMPTLWAIQAKRTILLANKDSLVVAGQLIMAKVDQLQASLLPIDSEHNGLLQCLLSLAKKSLPVKVDDSVHEIGITASGGPFWHTRQEQLAEVTCHQACQHPVWTMGKKNSIDSATMANKALEIIEAHWLFSCPAKQIKVLIHPQSQMHAWVTFQDGNTLIHASQADMRLAIAQALGYPNRLPIQDIGSCDWLVHGGQLVFEPYQHRHWMMLDFGYQVLEAGGLSPALFATANHYAVTAFSLQKCSFLQIRSMVEWALQHIQLPREFELENVFDLMDEWDAKLRHQFQLTKHDLLL